MRLSDNWYVIYKTPYGDIDFMMKIFKHIASNRQKILFSKYYMNFNDLDREKDEDLIENFFNSFVGEYVYFEDKELKVEMENEIKGIIDGSYDVNTLSDNDGEENIHLLLKKAENCINNDVLEKIKLYITKKLMEAPSKNDHFIKERTIFQNQKSFYFAYPQDEEKYPWYNSYASWYKVEGDEELRKALEIDHVFEAIVTNDLNEFENYSYAVTFVEQVNCMIAINDRVGDFKERIEPLLRKEFRDKYEIVHNGESKKEPGIEGYELWLEENGDKLDKWYCGEED